MIYEFLANCTYVIGIYTFLNFIFAFSRKYVKFSPRDVYNIN